MTTNEIAAYLWGQAEARRLYELQTRGGNVVEWLREPTTPEELAVLSKLGPDRYVYWIARGVKEFRPCPE